MAAFNRAAWDGERPLVAPLKVTFDELRMASPVFEAKPDTLDADYFARGGIVIKKGRDADTGRPWVEALNTRGPATSLQIVRYRLWFDELGEIQPATRRWAHGTARRVCRSLGAASDAAYFTARDAEHLLIALGLVHEEFVA